MASTDVAFRSSLSDEKIEYAYSQCMRAMDARRESFAQIGFRAAKARDEKLLIALERMAESTLHLQEQQVGRLMRSPDAKYGETKGTTEHQMCREAYRLCDEGNPTEHFSWIYGAAALLCGYIV